MIGGDAMHPILPFYHCPESRFSVQAYGVKMVLIVLTS